MVNKKAENIGLEEVMFIILNLIFIFMLGVFVYSSGHRYFVYEETYAKQIALIIDNAKPDMVVLMNVNDIVDLSIKNNKNINDIFKIDEKEKRVVVSIGESNYAYQYFSNYNVSLQLNNGYLTIGIKK